MGRFESYLVANPEDRFLLTWFVYFKVEELQIDKEEKHDNQCTHCVMSFKKLSNFVCGMSIYDFCLFFVFKVK